MEGVTSDVSIDKTPLESMLMTDAPPVEKSPTRIEPITQSEFDALADIVWVNVDPICGYKLEGRF